MLIGLLRRLSMRLCTLASLLWPLAVKSAWQTGDHPPDTRTTNHSRCCQATLAYQSLSSAKCDLAFLHCSVLFDLLLWDAYPTSACNNKVGRRSWKACTLRFRPLRSEYMCTAATIEYSLSLGFWDYYQPLLIAIQLVCDHASESER